MARHSSDSSQSKLYSKAVQVLHDSWRKNGETLRHADGKLFRACVVITYIAGIFYLVMMLATLIGLLLKLAATGTAASAYRLLVYDTRLTLICLVLLIAVLIFHRLHKYIVSGVLMVAEALLFLPNQALDDILTGGAWKRLVLFTLPTAILTIAALYMLGTLLFDRLAVKRVYNDFVRRIQATHTNEEGQITSQEQWDAYVEQFLLGPVHAKPKKSLRKKAQKSADSRREGEE